MAPSTRARTGSSLSAASCAATTCSGSGTSTSPTRPIGRRSPPRRCEPPTSSRPTASGARHHRRSRCPARRGRGVREQAPPGRSPRHRHAPPGNHPRLRHAQRPARYACRRGSHLPGRDHAAHRPAPRRLNPLDVDAVIHMDETRAVEPCRLPTRELIPAGMSSRAELLRPYPLFGCCSSRGGRRYRPAGIPAAALGCPRRC